MKIEKVKDFFKDRAVVLEYDKHTVLLHDINTRKYFATVNHGKKIVWNDKDYDNADKLISDILEYNKTLEWPAEVYDPMMRESYRRDLKIKLTLKKYDYKAKDRFSNIEGYVHQGKVIDFKYPRIHIDNNLTDDDYKISADCFLDDMSYINIFDTDNMEEARNKIDGFILGLYSYNISVMIEKIIDIDPSKLDNIFEVTNCKNIFNPTKEKFDGVIADKLEAVAKRLRTLNK